jgi:hypothetical protein
MANLPRLRNEVTRKYFTSGTSDFFPSWLGVDSLARVHGRLFPWNTVEQVAGCSRRARELVSSEKSKMASAFVNFSVESDTDVI